MAAVEIIQEQQFPQIDQAPYLRLVSLEERIRPLRTGPTLAQRRQSRTRMLQRRHRTYVALLLVAGLALALIETVSAKVRVFRAPEFLATAFLFAVLGLLVRLLLGA